MRVRGWAGMLLGWVVKVGGQAGTCRMRATPWNLVSSPLPLLPVTHAPRLHLAPTAADPDKVAAAQEVLDRVAAAFPAARAVVREMGELIDGYIELVGG